MEVLELQSESHVCYLNIYEIFLKSFLIFTKSEKKEIQFLTFQMKEKVCFSFDLNVIGSKSLELF